MEADKLTMCKEKEKYEPGTSGLQDQRFSQLELKSNHKIINLSMSFTSLFSYIRPRAAYFVPFTKANRLWTKQGGTRFVY